MLFCETQDHTAVTCTAARDATDKPHLGRLGAGVEADDDWEGVVG